MKTTLTISANLNTSIFEVFEQDVDEVIMLINFYLAYGQKTSNTPTTASGAKKEQRIRVNDKTATGGWF